MRRLVALLTLLLTTLSGAVRGPDDGERQPAPVPAVAPAGAHPSNPGGSHPGTRGDPVGPGPDDPDDPDDPIELPDPGGRIDPMPIPGEPGEPGEPGPGDPEDLIESPPLDDAPSP